MQKLTQIDQQILKPQTKKKQLEMRQAVWLYKQLQKILKGDFSEELILGLVNWADSELKSNPDRREVWVKSSAKFRKSYSVKAQTLHAKNNSTAR